MLNNCEPDGSHSEREVMLCFKLFQSVFFYLRCSYKRVYLYSEVAIDLELMYGTWETIDRRLDMLKWCV